MLTTIKTHHHTTTITNIKNVITRDFIRTDMPGTTSIKTIPLFDTNGTPLPTKKTNNT